MNDPYLIQQRKTRYEYEMKMKKLRERSIILKMVRDIKREEILKDYNGKYCDHRHKVEMNGMKICYDCGLELGRQYGENGTSYNFKNHVMRGKRR